MSASSPEGLRFMVKLANMLRQPRAFNLEHPTFQVEGKPSSLSIGPRATVEVPADALKCVEIQNALKPRKGLPTLRVV